jgi:hypothetical protein
VLTDGKTPNAEQVTDSNVNIAIRGDSREHAAVAQLVVLFDYSLIFIWRGISGL